MEIGSFFSAAVAQSAARWHTQPRVKTSDWCSRTLLKTLCHLPTITLAESGAKPMTFSMELIGTAGLPPMSGTMSHLWLCCRQDSPGNALQLHADLLRSRFGQSNSTRWTTLITQLLNAFCMHICCTAKCAVLINGWIFQNRVKVIKSNGLPAHTARVWLPCLCAAFTNGIPLQTSFVEKSSATWC